MQDALSFPDDLNACQRLLQELYDVLSSVQTGRDRLQQENEELQLLVKRLQRQLYGRRSERHVESPGQGQLDFGDDNEVPDGQIISASEQQEEPTTTTTTVRRRRPRRPRSEALPEHLERRVERLEPTFPDGVSKDDCESLGDDVVELLEFERGKLWVRRLEYAKYKLPAPNQQPTVSSEPAVESQTTVTTVAAVAVAALQPAAEPIQSLVIEPADTVPQGTSREPAAVDRPSLATRVVPTANVGKGGILQAPRVVTLIEGGRFGFGLAAEVLFSKFKQHTPLYRQQDELAQLGWSPSRSTLGQIVDTSAMLFIPLFLLLKQRVLGVDVLGTDDVPVTLLTPGEGDGSRQARFWHYRGPNQAAPYNVFAFTDSRSRAGPDNFLLPYKGTLVGDCYSGYVNIEQVTGGRIRFAACLNHARRKVFDARDQQPKLGGQILAVIRELYDIEDRARPWSDAERLGVRQAESIPAMARLRTLLDSNVATCVLPKSSFGQALGYLRNHWRAFQVYLSDGRIPIDNNDTERDHRGVAIGRKNWLFIGSEAAGIRTATILSIVVSAHRHDLDVWSYLKDVLTQLAHAHADAGGNAAAIPVDLLASLLPDAWAKSHPDSLRTFRTDEKAHRTETRRFKRAEKRARAAISGVS